MSKDEVAELTWENGQLAMHGLGGLLPTTPTKPVWGRSNDTLESIVHQATCHENKDIILNSLQHNQKSPVPGMLKKRTRSESNQYGRNFGKSMQERADRSACASASATFCRDNDTTMMTWASYESPRSLKTKISTDEDSACHDGSENQDEDQETKTETGRPRPSRRSRAAAVHNQSERRRRDRINQKMKALQRLVPNASKTDKASMLDEVIDYLKQLQAQIQMMSAMNMPQMNMMIPLGMQQHLQMSLLARMGMGVGLGMGMGMLDINTMAAAARSAPHSLPPLIHRTAQVSATTPSFVPPPFMLPPIIVPFPPAAQANTEPGDANSSVTLPDPYSAFLPQSLNMELYNKMAALYRQQLNQTTQQATSCPSTQSDHMQGD